MPLWRNGRPRKRWRYVGVYCDKVMLAAARVQIGVISQTFWSLLDRESGEALDRTRMVVGGDVSFEGETMRLDAGEVRAEVTLGGGGEAIESVCPSGERGYAWTRKRSGVEVSGTIEVGGRGWRVDGPRGMDDQSAGYHARHTNWLWSAGVGTSRDGRDVAWNLVTGINDPPRGSERAIWVDGPPSEPEPVVFEGSGGLDGIRFAGGEQLSFSSEADRSREDNALLIKSSYTHRFGAFSGYLGGIELASGLGVMERHSALW